MYQIILPTLKQGDDMAVCLSQTESPQEALRLYAEVLNTAAENLSILASKTENTKIEINANSYFIGISGPNDLLESLADEGLINKNDILKNDSRTSN